MPSWKPEVLVSGAWSSNALRFATESEAAESAKSLFHRWALCSDHRATRSDDPPLHCLDLAGRLQDLPPATSQGHGTPPGDPFAPLD